MTRYDLTAVSPQGGYVAKQCPVRAQNDVLRPSDPLPASPELQRRFDRGREFEDTAVERLEEVMPETVVAAAETEEELEASTADAMASRVSVIAGGRLPTDRTGKRVGKPDLLVLADDGGYRPVDVKHHMALEPSQPDRSGLPALCSSLAQPRFEDATTDDRFWARKREEDLLQLAHYQRMLETAGLAAPSGRWGGIVGTEQRVVWYDLDAPIWKTSSSTGKQKMRSTMERYDFEFDFRLDVIAVAHAHLQDSSVDLLVEPAAIGECAECPWRDHCRKRLESGSGDVSLLPRIGWRQRKIHLARGVRDRAELASLDVRTARLVSDGVNVAEMQSLIEGLPPETPVGDLAVVVRSKKALAALEGAGVRTFGDLAALSAPTALYADAAMATLPEQIDLARAVLGPAPIYRRRDVETLLLPRADVEVDVDMESVEQGVYLWGALVSDRRKPDATPRYMAFATWNRLDPDTELQNSLRFWEWLATVRDEATRNSLSFRAYCYNASAENTYLRRLGLAGGILEEVNAFIRSEQWVDVLKVVDTQLMTGAGMGLKKVAPLAGFSWSVDGAGGDASMLRYDVAVGGADPQGRDDARDWLLTYNRCDVEAFRDLAVSITENAKGLALLTALETGFAKAAALGAANKAVIFTESRRTQNYLIDLLTRSGYENDIVLFNGSNSDPASKAIYQEWKERYAGTDSITGSPTADMRAALVEQFRTKAKIMIATEAAAEGINLQFCSMVVNYDLPWNPQRIEQRIGRCHRYGQKHDVVVINFLNKANAADLRVFELLDEKFRLFSGVFGASDDVLGTIESGVDFERRIVDIYQSCRTTEEIDEQFEQLRFDLDEQIAETMDNTRLKLLEHFDAEVHDRLRVSLAESAEFIDKASEQLWRVTSHILRDHAEIDAARRSFSLTTLPGFASEDTAHGRYRLSRDEDDEAHRYRPQHPLALAVLDAATKLETPHAELIFDYSDWPVRAEVLAPLVGTAGTLVAEHLQLGGVEPEDHLLLAAVTDDGRSLTAEQAHRLFDVPATIREADADDLSPAVEDLASQRVQALLDDISARQGTWFDAEMDKLDRWAEDKRAGLKTLLREHDDALKSLKREARQAASLPDKLAIQKKIKEVEATREGAWRAYDAEAREVETAKEGLIDDVESRLAVEQSLDRVFAVRFTVV